VSLDIKFFWVWVWVLIFLGFGFGLKILWILGLGLGIYPSQNPDFFGLNALWPIFAKNRKKMKICKYDQI